MNGRRSFFKNLIGGASAVAVVATQASAETALVKPAVIEVPKATLPDTVTFGEWRIDWSGWKEENNSESVYGRWTAKPASYQADGNFSKGLWGFHGVFASTGGFIGVYHLGDMFSHVMLGGEPWLLISSPESLKAAQRVKTFKKLMAFLRGNPLADSQNCFRCGPIEKSDENFKNHGYGY